MAGRRMLVGGTATILLVATIGAFGCILDFYDGVHFHNGNPDFGIAPRRGNLYWEHDDRAFTVPAKETQRMGGAGKLGMELSPPSKPDGSKRTVFQVCEADGPEQPLDTSDSVEQAEAGVATKAGELVAAARKAVTTGDWSGALEAYRKAGALYGWERGSLRDRVETLERVIALPPAEAVALTESLKLYQTALDDSHNRRADLALTTFRNIAADPKAGFLREHALYQQACVAHGMFKYDQAITQFQQFLTTYPKSPKREAALIMMARCAILPRTPAMQQLSLGEKTIAQLLQEFPRTRFREATRGLQARVLLLRKEYQKAFDAYIALGDVHSAREVLKTVPRPIPAQFVAMRGDLLAAYLLRMDRAKTYRRYETSISVIKNLSENMTPPEALRFRQKLMASDDIAGPYFYYRLNHCENDQKSMQHLAELADQYVPGHARNRLAPSVRARLAEVYYRNGNFLRAFTWAESAIDSVARDRALFVRGAIFSKRHETTQAIGDFESILRDCPQSPLRHGVRENLALLYERKGDLASALDQYFALDYHLDVAYMLDARMSTQDVAAYRQREADILKNPAVANKDWRSVRKFWTFDGGRNEGEDRNIVMTRLDLVDYSLGIRLLRDGKWADAATALKRVPAKAYNGLTKVRKEFEDTKRPVPEPVVVATDLERLERGVEQAKDPKTRAQALYDYANYYGDHGNLLFYNPALWQGEREFSYQFHWNEGFSDARTVDIIRRHMMEHEVYPRARALFLRVANEYPDSPLAPKSLYRAAVACHRLSNFNYWWVDVEAKRHDYARESLALKKNLIKRYPHDPLVRQASRKPVEERQLDWTPANLRRTVGNRVSMANPDR